MYNVLKCPRACMILCWTAGVVAPPGLTRSANAEECSPTKAQHLPVVREPHQSQRSTATGDLDDDGDVDLFDYAVFLLCVTGPGGGVPDLCESADFDADQDIDFSDAAGFQRAFTGPGPPCPCSLDIDGDGHVGPFDLLALRQCQSTGGAQKGCDVDCNGAFEFCDVEVALCQPPSGDPECCIEVICGACLLFEEPCSRRTEASCDAIGGIYQGNGTTCP